MMDNTPVTGGDLIGARDFRPLNDANTLRELVFNIREGIYITTPDGAILDANPALIEVLGAGSLEELQRRNTRDLYVSQTQWEAHRAQIERDGSVHDFEMEVRLPDGTVRTMLDTCYLVRDPETSERVLYGILIDISQRKELEVQLKKLLVRDPLTGCFNRRYLDDLEAKADEADRAVGAIVIDVDKFKDYNDLHGHAAGDDVLIKLAKFLMREARSDDAVVRTGGDEFVVILQGESVESTRNVALRYAERAKFAAPVPVSLGWAIREPGEKLQKTVQRADEELIHIRLEERRPSRRGARRTDSFSM
jgi:diguanylate cyclase (GGDEF)-like protein/PAS domain S-box-containing protein